MRVKHKYPPNYKEIVKHFPVVAKMYGVVFTYGDILYSPDKSPISPDLRKHEETHRGQQAKMGKDEWWEEYFNDPIFRLAQELEAYRNQYQYAVKYYNRQLRRRILRKISKDLSCPLYGNIIGKKEAADLIKND